MKDEYMTTRGAASYTSLSESYLKKLRMDTACSVGPNFLRLGERTIRYRKSDLDAWMSERSAR